jgi:protein-S-isoprenylcysteine O-methyltransferase Ste14
LPKIELAYLEGWVEISYRLLFFLVLASAFAISGTYRRRARQTGEMIQRREEGIPVLIGRMMLALPLLATLVLYILYPRVIAWAQFNIPAGYRWVSSVIAIATIPFQLWVFRNIGRNISETVLTKEDHVLITTGPYRWIRHPLYTGSILMLFSLSLVAANWILVVYSLLALILFRLLVIPAEEQQLVNTFGSAYRDYQARTGAILPKFIQLGREESHP